MERGVDEKTLTDEASSDTVGAPPATWDFD